MSCRHRDGVSKAPELSPRRGFLPLARAEYREGREGGREGAQGAGAAGRMQGAKLPHGGGGALAGDVADDAVEANPGVHARLDAHEQLEEARLVVGNVLAARVPARAAHRHSGAELRPPPFPSSRGRRSARGCSQRGPLVREECARAHSTDTRRDALDGPLLDHGPGHNLAGVDLPLVHLQAERRTRTRTRRRRRSAFWCPDERVSRAASLEVHTRWSQRPTCVSAGAAGAPAPGTRSLRGKQGRIGRV